jgi:initiation factor 1A
MPRGVKTARTINKAPKRDFVTKDYDGTQSYGTVTKLLGHGRVVVMLEENGVPAGEKQCSIRGSMRKREWVNMNDIVLVAFREFGETHDIIRKYTDAEVHELKRLGELVTSLQGETAETDVVFEDI